MQELTYEDRPRSKAEQELIDQLQPMHRPGFPDNPGLMMPVKVNVGATKDGNVVLVINDQPLILTLQGAWDLANAIRSTANRLGHDQDRQRHKKK